MTCGDVEPKLDSFIDTELAPRELVEVARHVASCPACDTQVQEMVSLHEAVVDVTEADVDGIDVGVDAIWPRLEASMDAADRFAARPSRVRPLRAMPMWAAGMAIAAGVLMMVRSMQTPTDGPTHVAAAPSVVIDRLAGRRVAVQREPVNDTTVIWVDYDREIAGR